MLNSLFHSDRRTMSVVTLGLLALCLLTFAPAARAQEGPSVPSIQAPEDKTAARKEEVSIQTKAARGEAPLGRLYDYLKVESSKVYRLPALPASKAQRTGEKRLRVGEVRPFERPLKSLSDSTLYNVPDGEVRVMGLVSEGALSTRVHFTKFALPKGARLFVYSAKNPEDFNGPYTERGPAGNGDFWTPAVEGDEAVVEYFVPKSANASTEEAFTISEVGHIFTDPFLKAAAGSCNLEVTPDWANVAKSVGALQFVTGGSIALCTGTLLNDQAQDLTPYLLTANHCFDTQAEAQSLVVYWNYLTGDNPPGGTPSTSGATLLATNATSDFTLVRLTGTLPGGLVFAGWDASPTPSGTAVTGIHHPQGSHKRISFGTTITACATDLPGPCQNWTPVHWNQGTTEGGSSGSGIWKGTPADARLVGTLTGGQAACNNLNGTDYYGSFSVTYQNISSFLSGGTAPTPPANNNFTSAQVLNGCNGTVNGTNIAASKEAGELSHGGNVGGASVWYQWQAPGTGSVTITTAGSNFDTLLAVYTGNSVGGLTLVTQNDDIPGTTRTSSVTFNATAGVTYRIAVDGFRVGANASTGNIVLNWNAANCVPPTVQFNQSSYTVSEGAGFINIVVTRSDTTGAATVKYATSDSTDANFLCNQVTGVASRKCDYHIASGKLRFAAGEASKQFTLSIINDVYVEGPETLTLTLSSPTGANLGANSVVPLTITDNDAGGAANPIDQTAFYVRQLYVDLLSREPDPSGLSGWTTRIDQCGQPGQPPPPCDRVTVGGDGFLRSGEFFDRQFFVLRLYRTGLGRILRYDEVGDLAYVSGFLTDTDLELNKQDLVADIMARTEFSSRYNGLDNTQFVDTLLQTAVVTVPADVRLAWINALNGGSKTRAQVYREISERAEVINRYAHEAQVVSAYYGFFTRNPDGAYLNYLQRLDSGEINLGDLANAFINASEYRQRFGQF